MHLKILGTKGEIPLTHPAHSKQSGILIDGKLMLDLEDKRFLKEKPKWILITHLHPDHAYREKVWGEYCGRQRSVEAGCFMRCQG